MKKLVYAALALALVGCASVRVVGRESNPAEKEEISNVCGWTCDLEGGKKTIELPDRATIGSVEMHSSYWYAWGTVLSFGLWIPFDMTYEVNQ